MLPLPEVLPFSCKSVAGALRVAFFAEMSKIPGVFASLLRLNLLLFSARVLDPRLPYSKHARRTRFRKVAGPGEL
jgi:hypothetical protein